ncbi:MAG: bifunctional 4-hydroxy-2-oxoglutarate aldolase/2-dehydro-3-deoxy-phosphogluconate aldolase [Spirochaetaceae bacterium]|nr:bifunctional 4-hydroxy-2-oxoglutarate aldolase/2-dehydro-3-deoxy-phosphogluconate aldolase [Spirochaetaceae bacterium]
MSEIFPQDLIDKLTRAGIVAVVVFEDITTVIPTMQALVNAGISAIELAQRTPISLDAIKLVKKEFPKVLIGAGTVIKVDQIREVKAAGADFAVAPGLNRKVMDEALSISLPFAPGITTASDIETALEYNVKFLKFFPAESIGGLKYLNAINGPYKYLGIKYLPLGGVNIGNSKDYLKNDIISCIGGSWIANTNLINNKEYKIIEQNANEAMTMLKEIRK